MTDLTDEQTIKTIVDWCLEDEGWRKVFQLEDRSEYMEHWEYGGVDKEPEFTESYIVLDCCDLDGERRRFKCVPLTQFLLSPETVRVCIKTRYEIIHEGWNVFDLDDALRDIATAPDRVAYYRDKFVQLVLKRREG